MQKGTVLHERVWLVALHMHKIGTEISSQFWLLDIQPCIDFMISRTPKIYLRPENMHCNGQGHYRNL